MALAKGFNPRAHAGRDCGIVSRQASGWRFQSTRPRGARLHARCGHWDCSRRFNPRAHAGRDVSVWETILPSVSFQSTRPRGARQASTDPAVIRLRVSIHAPTRGATITQDHRRAGCTSFNPRAHAGRDLEQVLLLTRLQRFQSTRPRGARHDYFGLPTGKV